MARSSCLKRRMTCKKVSNCIAIHGLPLIARNISTCIGTLHIALLAISQPVMHCFMHAFKDNQSRPYSVERS